MSKQINNIAIFTQFLSGHCPLVEASHLKPADQTWRSWLMHATYRLMDEGEGFRAYAHLETNWREELSAALMKANIQDLVTFISSVFSDACSAAKTSKTIPAAIRWYIKREVGSSNAAESIAENLAAMLTLDDRYDARYAMRDLYEIRHRSHFDKCTFTQFNAWVWDRDRTHAYSTPLYSGETLLLLVDMGVWAKAFAPEHEEMIRKFVEEFRSGSIDVATVRAVRMISTKIDRSKLVRHPQVHGRRSHITVNHIHSLLDNIEHLGRSDISFYL